MRYTLPDRQFDLLDTGAQVPAVSRSIHYGLCLTFEGIRFFARKNTDGGLEVNFLNLDHNLRRFRRGISFNLADSQQEMVPTEEQLIDVFVNRYFSSPEMQEFLEEMAGLGAQGYLRPFTIDEEQSIGVTYPGRPAIRAVVCRYDRYLGEPFSGVAVPNLVRAVGANGTGCLKLGVNYLMSVKAVDAARKIQPAAASALFLDDQLHLKLEDRHITEWDSSCCLFALRDGTVIKIPESNLILPSVTIAGITHILRHMGVTVDERHMTYGELLDRSRAGEVVAVCSVGTAGILSRAQSLLLVNERGEILATQEADPGHALHAKLWEARDYYWNIYREKVAPPPGLTLNKFSITSRHSNLPR
jgi:branched-subunit amino acid aminotransferase/4-amino-4-deoxychorismate lyase